MIKIFRCRICGDPYVGYEKPSNCPFCGAHIDFIVDADEWVDENKNVHLGEISRRNLEKALELEMSNSAFYKCAAEQAVDVSCAAMFKALSKIEAEHASVISKLLSIPEPDISKIEISCARSDISNIEESSEREKNASEFYAKAAEEATELRVREVFRELVEIERDHLELDNIQKERLLKKV